MSSKRVEEKYEAIGKKVIVLECDFDKLRIQKIYV